MNTKMLNGKVVVITGGSGLLGQEFAKTVIANEGIAVITDVIKNDDIKFESENIDFIQMDITSKQSVQDAIKDIKKKYRKIDALINNAYPRNKNYGKKFFDVEYKDFVDNIGMHLGGYFLTSQQFSKYFYNNGGGNIINISSIYGVIAPKFEIYDGTPMTMPVEYAAIKSGLIHLTKYMSKYFKGKNIRVNAISPGGIFDQQNENFLSAYNKECLSKGILNKSDLNGTLLFLLSDLSQNINGQNIIVDDGFTL